MRNPLSKTITTIEPSGIRKFFDIVSEMDDAISLGVESRILIHRGIFVMGEFIPLKKEELFLLPMQV